MFGLAYGDAFGPPVPDDGDYPCGVCGERRDHDEMDNMIIQCDGVHDPPTGIHQRCMAPPIDFIPIGEWLCPSCVHGGLWVISEVHGRKVDEVSGKVCYLVSYNGVPRDVREPEWHLWDGFAPGARPLANAYNRRVAQQLANASCERCAAPLGDAPRVVCAGDHDTTRQFHPRCVGLHSEPAGDWICASCIADGKKCPQSIEAKGSTDTGHVVYLVHHWGSEDAVWLRPRDFPSRRSARLMKVFNDAQRERETKTKADAAARGGGSRSAAGSRV